MSKKTSFAIILVVILLGAGAYYWFVYRTPAGNTTDNTSPTGQNGFTPFGRGTVSPGTGNQTTGTSTNTQGGGTAVPKLPTLRQLSTTPIGGFMASSTASSTLVRYIDRGVGHVYEATSITDEIDKISNTTLPRVYQSYWNKNASALVLQYIKDGSDSITNFYAEILPQKMATSSIATTTTPYQIKGKFLSPQIQEIATSPKGDRIFTFNIEDGRGIGYVSGFDESKKTKIFDSPLMQMNVEWPEENTVALTTKGSAASTGFLYLLDVKKAISKKILGGIMGLSTKVSSDAKKVLFSTSNGQNITLSVYTIKDGTTQTTLLKTLADKCVWSKLHVNEVYCAVPTDIPAGVYPDDWYKGTASFVDQIWYLDTSTGEVHLLANPLQLSKALVDAYNLSLDPKENFLYFVNKRDLTLWSLDLNQ